MKSPAALALLAFTLPIKAADLSPYALHGHAQLRGTAVDSDLRSFTRGGTGLLRFDEGSDGAQSGQLLVDAEGPLSETLRGRITALARAEDAESALDVTEAYIEWRPYPRSHWRWRSKLGAFYPPVSLENRGVGWQSVYSLSPSAINTWIGEEVRAVGLEIAATSVGAPLQRPFDMSVVAGIYGWNDPMGILLFQRGWAIHDRESALFESLPRPFPRGTTDNRIEFFHEIDDRPGYYVGLETKWRGRHVLRLLHYDNRADPAQSSGIHAAWLSRFDALGARLELPSGLTLIAQGMRGDTAVGRSPDGAGMLIAEFWSYFALGSATSGAHRLTLRYDRMHVQSTRGTQFFDSRQNAHAWTLAYFFDWSAHWRTALEGVRIDGSLGQRARAGLAPQAIERQVQLAIRYSF